MRPLETPLRPSHPALASHPTARRRTRVGTPLLTLTLLLSGCSFESSGAPARDLDRPDSVSEVAWEWEAGSDTEWLNVLPVFGGIAVLDGAGVTVLDGGTGEVRWEYRPGSDRVVGAVTSDGAYVVLEEDDPDRRGSDRMHVVDAATGESVRESAFDLTSRRAPGSSGAQRWIRHSLSNVSLEHELWLNREDSEAVGLRWSDGEAAWSSSEVRDCDGIGAVGSLALVDEVLLGAVTCYPWDEQAAEDDPDHDPLYDTSLEFDSQVVAWNAVDGAELWRLDLPGAESPLESRNRRLTVHPSGVVSVDLTSRSSGYWIDPATAEYGLVEEAGVVGVFDEGRSLGLWRNGRYRIEDRSGEVSSRWSEPSGHEPPLVVSGGTLRVEDLEGASGEMVFARFHNEDTETELSREFGEGTEILPGAVVPGAVVVPYLDVEGGGVLGLR